MPKNPAIAPAQHRKEIYNMASVRKRGNGYQITVSNGRNPDGSQIVETATYTPDPGMTERQIKKALNEFVVDFERNVKSGQNVKGERLTFAKLSELFIDDMDPDSNNEFYLEKTSWYCYKRTLEQRIIPHLGSKKIGTITAKVVNDYLKLLRSDGIRLDEKPGGLSEATIRKDRSIISSILSYAVSEGYLKVNPLIYSGKQKRHKSTDKEYEVKYFTIDQTKRFLWALDSPIAVLVKGRDRKHKNGSIYHVPDYTREWTLSLMWRAYFYLSLFCGDRRGENIALTWEDVNFDTGEVDISKSTAYAEKEIIQKSTKTNKSRKAVIPGIVINILRQWKKEQKEICIKLGDKWVGYRGDLFDENYIFIQWNGKQVHPSSPYHQFKRIIRIYNDNVAQNDNEKLPEDATPHGLRHTAASILIANNMDARSVAGVLGHADPTTTLNIYSYFFQSKNAEAANIMESVLSTAK